MNNGTVEFITSEVVAEAFYGYLSKQLSWQSFLYIQGRWFEGGTPA